LENADFIGFVKQFRTTVIVLAGGYLRQRTSAGWDLEEIEMDGCLGYIAELLKDHKFKTRTLNGLTFNNF